MLIVIVELKKTSNKVNLKIFGLFWAKTIAINLIYPKKTVHITQAPALFE